MEPLIDFCLLEQVICQVEKLLGDLSVSLVFKCRRYHLLNDQSEEVECWQSKSLFLEWGQSDSK